MKTQREKKKTGNKLQAYTQGQEHGKSSMFTSPHIRINVIKSSRCMKKRNFAIKITLSFRPTRHIKVKSLKEIEEVLEKSWSRMAVSKVWCFFTLCVLLSLVVACYSDETDADAPIG